VLCNKIEELKEKQDLFGEQITYLDDFEKKLIVKSYYLDQKGSNKQIIIPPRSE